jgi:hypothetical protein
MMEAILEQIRQAELLARKGSKTKPACPVFTSAAIAEYENARHAIDTRLAQLEQAMKEGRDT